MKKLPLGIQSLGEIVAEGYAYVDKTQYVFNLINDAKYYFLSRPRRFGKSLLLDTIAEAFSGNKELFKGLFLYDSGYDFKKHPVLRLDMSNISNDTPEIMINSLSTALKRRACDENLDIVGNAPSEIFQFLIEDLYKKYGQRVVVLIDEYDKPILDNIDNIEIAENIRKVLKGFYGILKSMDPFLRLTFITGVTKFTKTSVFSGLNNLRDITLTEKYSNICGITLEDLDKYFNEYLEKLASQGKFGDFGTLRDRILSWYDGYSWDGTTRVINPFSLLYFFTEEKFSGFWYSSGTPKFLTDLIKKRQEGYTDIKNLEMGEWALDTFDIQNIEVEALLFQTGYLTVKGILHEQEPPVYLLDIPNYEVRIAFNLHILAEFTQKGGVYTETAHRRIKQSLKTGDLQSMLETFKGLFAAIPYQLHIAHEAYYHSIFYAIMNLLGFDIDSEVSVSGGRIDGVLELDDKVYVMEFKYENCEPDAALETKRMLFEKSLSEGMKQIEDRGYYKKYLGSGKTIYKAAFAFLGRDDIDIITSVSSSTDLPNLLKRDTFDYTQWHRTLREGQNIDEIHKAAAEHERNQR